MVSVRKQVESPKCLELVTVLGEQGDIACKCNGIAGHVDDLLRSKRRELVNDLATGTRTRRVENHGSCGQAAAL